jgi:hypothetical protein
MNARSLARPYRQILKAGAVVTLFLLGASALRAQTTAAVNRQDLSRPDPTTVAPAIPTRPEASPPVRDGILAAIFGPKRTRDSRSDRARRKGQAVSDWNRSVDYSGPRFGFTYLPQAVVDSLKAHNIDVGSTISQFGWQLEREIHVSAEGPMVLNEWIFLAGGLEKGVFLPSASWMVGARGRSGNEIGFGPNVSLAGVGLALAAGVTVRSGGLHFPMNVAAASSRGGIRVSFLTGFTLH